METNQNNEPKPQVEKQAGGKFIKNDLLGADEWRKSKFSYIVGYGAAKKAVSSIGNTGSDAWKRTTSILQYFTNDRPVVTPELDNPDDFETPEQRFREAARMLKLTQSNLAAALRNTYRSFYLYAALVVATIILALVSTVFWEPFYTAEYLTRMGPLPVFSALLLRAGYTNWVIRNKSAASFYAYITSKAWAPKQR
jgi:hypothetical protein